MQDKIVEADEIGCPVTANQKIAVREIPVRIALFFQYPILAGKQMGQLQISGKRTGSSLVQRDSINQRDHMHDCLALVFPEK